MSSVTLRELEWGDLHAVATIEASVNPQPWSRQLFEGELNLSPNCRHWLVAVSSGTIVGFGGVMFAADTAHLMSLGVAGAQARNGIGQRLCVELFREARRRGASELTLEVRLSNAAAIALYEKFNMTRAGIRPGYYPDGEDALILWIHDLASTDVESWLQELSVS